MTSLPPKPAPLDHEPEGKPEVDQHLVGAARLESAAADAAQQTDRRLGQLVEKMQEEVADTEQMERQMPAPTPIRSILAALDLEEGSGAILLTAAELARRTGAALHLVHSVDFQWVPAREPESYSLVLRERSERAELHIRRLAAELAPAEVAPVSQEVNALPAHQAILERAAEISADVIVLGPHRGGGAEARLLGTTADRVLRTAGVPCLVVREALSLPVDRIGVPTDLSEPSQRAIELALAWSAVLQGPVEELAPKIREIRVMHVGWPLSQVDFPDIEREKLRPEIQRQISSSVVDVPGAADVVVHSEVLWGNDPLETTVTWAERERMDLLVVSTHGRNRLQRALIGSMAAGLARTSPCPVLLVPPGFSARAASRQAMQPRLGRLMLATDFSDGSAAAATWASQFLAPESEALLLHVLDIPRPGRFRERRTADLDQWIRLVREGAEQRLASLVPTLAGEGVRTEVRVGEAAEELVRAAEEEGADLIVLGEQERYAGQRGSLGSTAERVIHLSQVPVFLARGLPAEAPRTILVAVDDSAAAEQALLWTRLLSQRFGAKVLVFHALIMAGPYASPHYPIELDARKAAQEAVEQAREWLMGRIRKADLDPEEAEIDVTVGEPRHEVPAAAARHGAELVVTGSRGAGAIRRALLGSVASAVLRRTTLPVLVVPGPSQP